MSDTTRIQVTDGQRVFTLNRRQCIEVELKLNVSPYGHAWVSIGDHLYNFGSALADSQKDLVVDSTQYDYLSALIHLK